MCTGKKPTDPVNSIVQANGLIPSRGVGRGRGGAGAGAGGGGGGGGGQAAPTPGRESGGPTGIPGNRGEGGFAAREADQQLIRGPLARQVKLGGRTILGLGRQVSGGRGM